ncbi:Hydroxyacylglutathione hydrolase [Austwickia sp. TVS 96-490-7B]|uniref:MBL fold metallo-hydrolase n=1 Tax=Austwickia sp. TVS 96-490-7B TaxID=2830843 RepID=UPI001C586DDE|nr:MBL fold metallo-hydrolase [Austwickia sp. TVS 96-490-7B]MBW3084926.1 Hydroxyacylglutathione hydrolase [Austwickia sp. TVS 96-490-7B]
MTAGEGLRYPVPPTTATQIRAWWDAGAGDAAPVSDAASVVLLRDRPDGVEVFVLRRAATMTFAPSAYVFPGGRLDPHDTTDLPWVGPSPAEWSRRLDTPDALTAQALVVAAARELFEECGILLAGPDAQTVAAPDPEGTWLDARRRLERHEETFAALLHSHRLVLRTDLLRAVAQWITPAFEPRRYDTRFFAAVVPTGQAPDGDCSEAEDSRWIRPADLLAQADSGDAMLLPPTRHLLRQLVPVTDAAQWIAAHDGDRPLRAVTPTPILVGDDIMVVIDTDETSAPAASSTSTADRTTSVNERITCVCAPNPGPLTLDGTNSWVLGAPDAEEVVVIDPGPADEDHLRRLLAVAGSRHVSQILLTHRHPDHAEGALRFAELAHAPVRALGVGRGDLADGDVVESAGITLHVLATPGHTGDSASFLLTQDEALLTGDTILGRGSALVAWPEGTLGEYLATLNRLIDMAQDGSIRLILPGHGAPIVDAAATLHAYREHRLSRLDQVRRALASGARTVQDVVEIVYADVDHALWPAASQSVRAQMDYLGT